MKNFIKTLFFSLIAITLSACATTPQKISYKPAIKESSPNVPVKTHYVPVPMPGQLMLKPKYVKYHNISKRKTLSGMAAVKAANKKAKRLAKSSQYVNAIMNFNYMEGALYQIYCAPLCVTDIQFQKGEHIISIAAGDTLRWQVSKTYSGDGVDHAEHLIVKPIDVGLTNTLVVTTDKRTYHLLLNSTNGTFMASVQWRYSDTDASVAMFNHIPGQGETNLPRSGIKGISIAQLHFGYRMQLMQGTWPDWMPKIVFNDGHKTYIQFPQNMQEAPTLFVETGSGNDRVVNYRVEADYYIVDGIITRAQLRLGQDNPTVVDIVKN